MPLLLLLSVGWAGPTEPLPSPVVEAFEQLAAPRTVQATFVQTQYRAVLTRPLESSGTLAFARPDRLRWEVDSPAPAVFVMRGAELGMAYPSLGVSEEISLADRPDLLGLVEGLTVWLRADTEQLGKDYAVSVTAETPLSLSLVPRDEALHRWIDQIRLVVAEDATHVQRVELVEPDGDRVVMDFTAVKRDEVLPDGVFDLP